MPRTISARTCLFGFVLLGILCAPARLAAQPAGEDIPGSVTRHIKNIQDGQTPEDIRKAREAFVKAYVYYDKQKNQGVAYAAEAAKLGVPVLAAADNGKDALMQIRQINLAMALSEMSQATIQPALGAMAAHRISAVRYLAWRGYLGRGSQTSARVRILRRGDQVAKAMFDVWKTRARLEPSDKLIAMLLQVMTPPPNTTLSPSTQKDAADAALAAVASAWKSWRTRLVEGELPLVQALTRHALPLLEATEKVLGDAKDKKLVLQLLVDLLSSAGDTYVQKADDESDEGKELTKALAELLTKTEDALGKMAGKNDRDVAKALGISDQIERITNVGIAVIEWGEKLKIKPVPLTNKPAPKPPATKPAGAATPGGTTKPAGPVIPGGPKKPAGPVIPGGAKTPAPKTP